MSRKGKSILAAAFSLLISAAYGVSLHAVTETWRVFGNDYRPWLWTIPAFLVAAVIAGVAIRFPRVWILIPLLLPLFLASKQRIKNLRLKDSVASCGNHSGFWQYLETDESTVLPASVEFADFLTAMDPDGLSGRSPVTGLECPGYKRVGTQTGVVFVGGGLRPASLRDAEVLIAFCSWQSHPIPYDHQHGLTWQPGAANSTNSGTFMRVCSDTTNMIAKIEQALEQGRTGVVPYSSDARGLLAYELEQRKQLQAREK